MNYDELRKAAQEATPGPWEVGNSCDNGIMAVKAVDPKDDVRFELCEVWGEDYDKEITPMSQANARFIALANPQTILSLLDDVERLREENKYHADEWQKEHERCQKAEAALATARKEALERVERRINGIPTSVSVHPTAAQAGSVTGFKEFVLKIIRQMKEE